MKKNFMAIASLLIAAMLLVVSCAPEANVEGKVEDNGLVNASLMATAAGKALTVTHEGVPLTYSVTLTAGWTTDDDYKMDEVVGARTINNVNIEQDTIPLGWISQGLWTVTVEGKRTVVTNEGEKKVTVVKGSTTKYITKDNAGVVVFLGTDTTSSQSTTIDFDIKVNELAKDNGNYSLKATIVRADNGTNPPSNPTLDLKPADNSVGNTRKYTGNTKLTPGYYKVTVQLLNGSNVIGGITRGILVTGESKIAIKGSVSASDFAKGSLTVIDPKVTIGNITAVKNANEQNAKKSITLSRNEDLSNNEVLYKGDLKLETSQEAESYAITYTVEASHTSINQSGVTISDPTYTWTVDGETPTREKASITDNSITVNYTAPGPKNVTCLVTYLCTVSIGETEYKFTFGKEAVASVLVKGPAVDGEAPIQTQSN